MAMPVAGNTSPVMPPSGQYLSAPVNTIVSQKGCDQAQVINLMEMTKVEYTHLQHLIQSHMLAQDGAEEVQGNPLSSTDCESEKSCKVSPSPYTSPECHPDASSSSSSATDVLFVSVPNNQGSEDSKEVKMLLYSDLNNTSCLGQSTPLCSGEVPSSEETNIRSIREAVRERTRMGLGSRPNPPARVCLEKRFACNSSDLTEKQEAQAAVLNTFLSILCNSTDITGIAVHSQPEVSSEAEKTAAVAHAYAGNQGNCCQLADCSKHPEDNASKKPSISKTADSVPSSPCIIYTDTTNEELVINIENDIIQKAVKRAKRQGARTLQVRNPNIIQGPEKWKPDSTLPAGKSGRTTRPPLKVNQRREKHNFKERDRRKRIRLCCNELNTLVPYCNSDTDTATTLQWTIAYLKYIREIYGDSLKQGFQKTFCGTTGVRIKPSCADDATKCEKATSKE
ncbi:hypothetical protein Q7C36_019529 [Tachysurus vachellii]|uniref:BHLH domain-containing protein n=1 Tax=Tachysurus vachellii TaxID=175792 RepID=A0AA88S8D0_TACVA|nr:hypothetical protein Q7C36_019529 [Tachysurus vachellii]